MNKENFNFICDVAICLVKMAGVGAIVKVAVNLFENSKYKES